MWFVDALDTDSLRVTERNRHERKIQDRCEWELGETQQFDKKDLLQKTAKQLF